uniref:Ig-like domain-containing protein n=1 Tax=Hippocampus comes TaxID=109280 RepID=A0A3Q2Y470_HIPCM
WSFGDGTKVVLAGEVRRPTVIVFPPSKEQLQTSNATAVCVAKGGFPSTWTLSWKLGGTPSNSGVFHSPLGEAGGDGLYSWTSTLSLPADQWTKAASVSCEATLAGQNPLTQKKCA